MTGKETKALFLMLSFMTVASAVQCYAVLTSQEEIRARQVTLEESHEEELISIYELLAASAFTQRTNMNISRKISHYLTHQKGQQGQEPDVTCEECWEDFEHLVQNMPAMSGNHGSYWDTFYKQPYEQMKKTRGQQ
jgi:hypothetical protein|tara:strand:- start:1039 stop:1446 length:408 start_codon:yes stop_codon:yes gene_type:complete